MTGRELYARWCGGSIAQKTNGRPFERLYADDRDCWVGLAAEVVPVNEVVAKLSEMELHDNTGTSYDEGYMDAWREFSEFVEACFAPGTGEEQ